MTFSREVSLRLLAVTVVLGVFFRPAVIPADEKSAAETLRAKGLLKRSAAFCLPEEVELTKQIAGPRAEVPRKKKAADEARQAATALEKKLALGEKSSSSWRQEWDQLNVQLKMLSPTSPQRNQLIQRLNVLAAMVNATPEQMRQIDKSLQDARQTAVQRLDDYIQAVTHLREQYKALEAKYKPLSEDKEVQKAIADYSEAVGRKCTLGPMKATTDALKKFEAEVMTDFVQIYQAGSRVWHVFVRFNDAPPQEMAIDTGASIIALPWKMADAVGLTPNSQSPKIELTLADGRPVTAQLVTADVVRVGRFSVNKVKCAVFPENLPEAAPLLGMTFLNHFTFKIDKEKSRLIMSALDAGGAKEKTKAVAAAPADAGAAPAEVDKTLPPADQLVKLLTPEGDLVSATGPVFKTREGKSIQFKPARRGPAETLRQRFGQPDRTWKIPGPGGHDEDNAAPWSIWAWGPVHVLVDDTGHTRFFVRMEEPKQEEPK